MNSDNNNFNNTINKALQETNLSYEKTIRNEREIIQSKTKQKILKKVNFL